MTRSLRIALLAGGLAAPAGLALWLWDGTGRPLPDPLPDPPGASVTPPLGAPARMIGTSAIGHGGPAAPPAAGPGAAMPGPITKEQKGTE